ncbi:hypothetical protein [Mucilaginibacter mallensis]|nr:hypothetical protein [Mucilaginibacter mallensis]
MKKIIMIVLLAAGLNQAKAQQLLQVKPLVPLSGGLNNYLKPDNAPLLSPLHQPKLDSASKTQFMGLDNNAVIVYDRMPTTNTSNVDRMPIVVPGEPGVKYTMLVEKVRLITDADNKPVVAP